MSILPTPYPLLTLILAASCYISGVNFANGQSFSLDRETYAPGDTIIATFSDTPGNGTDWIGIYPEGITPSGNPGSTLWFYTNNTRTAGGGVASGSVSFTNINLTPGYWTAFFLLNDGYELLSDGVPFTVVGPPALTVANPVRRPDELLRVTVTGRPDVPTDRLALFQQGQDPLTAEPKLWVYLDGTQNLPDTGVFTATFDLDLFGIAEGEWQLHFQAEDKSDLAPPVAVSIKKAVVINSFTVNPPYLDEAGTVSLEWDIDDGGLAVEKVEISHGAEVLDVTDHEFPAQEVAVSTSTNFLLTVNGTVTASTTVYLPAASSPSFTSDKTEYQEGEPIVISWSGASGGTTDWVGIYKMGDVPGSENASQWSYTRNANTGNGVTGSFTFNVVTNPQIPGNLNPLPEGEYFAGLLLNDGYSIEFGVIRFNVVAATTEPDQPFAVTEISIANDQLTLRWESLAGRTYTLQESADLQNWTPLNGGTALPGLAGSTSHTFSIPAGGVRYYHVLLDPLDP